jgi:DNA repair protein RecN (Recombination protein N)
MLYSLNIKNYVLIDELHLDFKSGFSVFTGETGAGKSILIDAIGLLMGNRFSTDMIRQGSDKAYIEAVFLSHSNELIETLRAYDLVDEDGQYILSRELDREGRSINRINHRAVNLSVLKEFAEHMIDIHHQHDTQYLLKSKSHLTLLDAYDSSDVLVNEVTELYQTYRRLVQEKETLELERYNPNDLEFLNFQIDEIETAQIKTNEDEDLETQQKRMVGFEKISARLGAAIDAFDGTSGVLERYYEALKSLKQLDELPELNILSEELNEQYFNLSERVAQLTSLYKGLNYDEDSLNYVQERLFTINRLKKKYGRTIEEILKSLSQFKADVERIENRHEHLERLAHEIEKAYQHFLLKAQELSLNRKTKAKRLETDILQQCQDLYLDKAQFKVDFQVHDGNVNGIDQVEFLISMNPGESLKPLIKIASGGELSRLMLGLKVIFNRIRKIETVIFDEIDAGVSGRVASAIGMKMHQLGLDAQVFSVTHLGQVAAHAQAHYYVVKEQGSERTQTQIQELDHRGRVLELAMIASGTHTEQALKAAQELLEDAQHRIQRA